ncbi:MAG: hypothetical protein WEB89_01760 [Balneolales bacterium]
MKTKLIDLGNSKGIEIPPSMLTKSGLTEEVELIVTPQGLRICPIGKAKKKYNDDSNLLDEEFLSGLSSNPEDGLL